MQPEPQKHLTEFPTELDHGLDVLERLNPPALRPMGAV